MEQLRCPSCGNVGEATTDESGVFEVRGKYEGKGVRKCRKCGAGLFIGAFSGAFFGKPQIIPPELWKRMEAVWEKEFGPSSRTFEESKKAILASEVIIQLPLLPLPSGKLYDEFIQNTFVPSLSSCLSGEEIKRATSELPFLLTHAIEVGITSSCGSNSPDTEGGVLLACFYGLWRHYLNYDRDSLDLLAQRLSLYSKVAPHTEYGKSYSVGKVFTNLCGSEDAAVTFVAASTWNNTAIATKEVVDKIRSEFVVAPDPE